MDYETIELELKDKVAVIRLNRPDVKNALNTQMRAEITQCVNQMGKEARVLVITGSGSAFALAKIWEIENQFLRLILNGHSVMNTNPCSARY